MTEGVDRDSTRGKGKGPGGSRQPVDAKTRARVRKLAREGMSRNAIAKQLGISTWSVSKICAEAKPPITFDRSAIKAATEARAIDLKAERAKISELAVAEVQRLFRLLVSPHEVIHWDKEGFMHRGVIDRPTSGDVKNYATAIGILTDKHLVITRHDTDGVAELSDFDAFLDHLTRKPSA